MWCAWGPAGHLFTALFHSSKTNKFLKAFRRLKSVPDKSSPNWISLRCGHHGISARCGHQATASGARIVACCARARVRASYRFHRPSSCSPSCVASFCAHLGLFNALTIVDSTCASGRDWNHVHSSDHLPVSTVLRRIHSSSRVPPCGLGHISRPVTLPLSLPTACQASQSVRPFDRHSSSTVRAMSDPRSSLVQQVNEVAR